MEFIGFSMENGIASKTNFLRHDQYLFLAFGKARNKY